MTQCIRQFISRNQETMRKIYVLEKTLHLMIELANTGIAPLVEFNAREERFGTDTCENWYTHLHTFLIQGDEKVVHTIKGYMDGYIDEHLRSKEEIQRWNELSKNRKDSNNA